MFPYSTSDFLNRAHPRVSHLSLPEDSGTPHQPSVIDIAFLWHTRRLLVTLTLTNYNRQASPVSTQQLRDYGATALRSYGATALRAAACILMSQSLYIDELFLFDKCVQYSCNLPCGHIFDFLNLVFCGIRNARPRIRIQFH